MNEVLVTGANGFIGGALCDLLVRSGHGVTGAVRALNRVDAHVRYKPAVVGDIDGDTDWRGPLHGVDVVVHLAAQAASRDDAEGHAALWRVNVAGAASLARQAAESDVRRLVYVSSIKVNGEQTRGRPFDAGDEPAPQDAYARSKLHAELAIRQVGTKAGLEVVIVRPPLVFGPGVRGNFLRLMRWIDQRLPLPLASVDNRRSLIALDNLADFLTVCVHHTAAAGQTLLISDGEDLSTPELMRRMAHAMRRPLYLWPAPPRVLGAITRVTGMRHEFDRLFGSLQIDTSRAWDRLSWRPGTALDEALSRTAAWYRKEQVSPS